MTETILIGIAGICIAGIGYLLRKAKVSREMADLITSALERFVIERAIHAAEAWAEKMEKKIGEKIAGSEKMKKAMELVKEAKKNLEKLGIKLDISLDEEVLKGKIQAVFDTIRKKLHEAG